MARMVLSPITVDGFNKAVVKPAIEAGAISPDEGAEISVAQDHLSGLLLVFKGGASARTVTIRAGNGVQAGADLEFNVGSDETVCICPESGRFKNMSGTDKGKIIIGVNGEGVSVLAYLLPLK